MKPTNRYILTLVLAATLAATSVQADEPAAPAKAAASAGRQSLERARAANEDAAKKAVEAVLNSTRLDLDIRLIGPTSVKIADER